LECLNISTARRIKYFIKYQSKIGSIIVLKLHQLTKKLTDWKWDLVLSLSLLILPGLLTSCAHITTSTVSTDPAPLPTAITVTDQPVEQSRQVYQSEDGQFSLEYPITATFYKGQQNSVDGVLSAADNTISIQDSSADGWVLNLTYYTLADNTSLVDFIHNQNDCMELSSLPGQSFSIQGHDALLYPDTNCGPYGTTFIYTKAGNMGYRFTIESYENYLATAPFIDPILKSFQTDVEDVPTSICLAPDELIPFAFSPDAAKLFVRAGSGVQIFDLVSGSLETTIRSSLDVVTAALSPNGQVLAWSMDDNTIQLVRISDQKVLHTLSGHTDMVTKLRFSPDGDFLVSASHDNSVRVWNMNGEELRSLQPVEALGIGISKDGSTLATVSFDGPVSLWDLDTLEKIKDLAASGGYDTSDAEFSPDGQYLAADLATGIFLWQVSDGSLVWNEVKNSMAVAFSPDGKYLAYSDVNDGNKVTLASPDAAQIFRTMEGMQSPVWELFFSPDASFLAATDSREIHVWRVEDGTLLFTEKTACP
jgi:WD40 repeat protein